MSTTMHCACGGFTDVKDSRGHSDGQAVRRRRLCATCGTRFTTLEVRADGTSVAMAGVDGAAPSVVRQAIELVDIIGSLESGDRLLLIGIARRMKHGAPDRLSRQLEDAITELGRAA